MIFDEVSLRQPKFYPWDTPQYWDTMFLQCLYETSTDKKLSGETSDASEESSKEGEQTTPTQTVFDMYHQMDELLTTNLRSETSKTYYRAIAENQPPEFDS